MVEKIEVEMFHQETNFVVLRLPGRAFPGIVIQGDTLAGIVGDLGEAITLFEVDRGESLESLQHLYDELKERLDDYHEICRRNGIE